MLIVFLFLLFVYFFFMRTHVYALSKYLLNMPIPTDSNILKDFPLYFRLLLKPEEFTFYDIGCGKGDVLRVCSNVKFKKCIGYEIDTSVAKIAQENTKDLNSVHVIVQDVLAENFVFENVKSVLFLYEPFHRIEKRIAQKMYKTLLTKIAKIEHVKYIFYVSGVYSPILSRAYLQEIFTDRVKIFSKNYGSIYFQRHLHILEL